MNNDNVLQRVHKEQLGADLINAVPRFLNLEVPQELPVPAKFLLNLCGFVMCDEEVNITYIA